MFDKTTYVENWVQNPMPPHEKKKPRLEGWDSESVVWPPIIPPPTRLKGKALLHEVEKEEKLRLKMLKPFDMPDYRTGDLIKFHYIHSLSEGKGNDITGVCIGRSKPNSLHSSFDVATRMAGAKLTFKVKENSPFLTNFSLQKMGSGRIRKKLTNFIEKDPFQKFDKPVKFGKKSKRGVKKNSSKKFAQETIKFDKIKIQ